MEESGIESIRGVNNEADLTLTFKNTKYAFEAMVASMKDQFAMMDGMLDKSVRLEGDPGKLMFFTSLMEFLEP